MLPKETTLKTVEDDFYEEHRKRHEDAQTELLENYTKYQVSALEQKTKFKRCFFVVSIIMMFIPPILLFSVYRAVYFGYIAPSSFTAVASIGGGLAALVADIMIIPKTIAEYCFNKEEDKYVLKWFSNAQRNDSKYKQTENDPWA